MDEIKSHEIEVYQLKEQIRKLDEENFNLKNQLKHRNKDVREQRKIIDKLAGRLKLRQKPRYRNQKGGRR